MIVEVYDPTKLSRKTEITGRLQELRHLKKAHHVSANDEEIVQLTNEKGRIKPNKFYVPDEVSEHQLHAINGTKWVTADKPEPERTYTRRASMMLYGGSIAPALIGSIGTLASGLVLPCICFVLWGLLALASFCSELNVVKDAVHNYRIKRTDVSGITAYNLSNGRLTNGLRLGLDDGHWDRLLEGLKCRDSELMTLMTKFCEANTELIKVDEEAYRLFDIETTDENVYRLDKINEIMLNLDKRTAIEITELFARRDNLTIESAQRAEEAAEHRAFVETIQASMDGKFAVDARLTYIQQAYNL